MYLKMASEEKEHVQDESEELTVDFSKQTLKKIERASNDQKLIVALILDDNEIQRLDNLDSYVNLRKLSLVNNQLIRMYGVSHLIHLQYLDMSNNSLVTIEGLKDLKVLKHLNLAKNKIKTIEHLNTNLMLEKIDLSENNISHISDLSYLEMLKILNLHGNKISHLRQCEKNLPEQLEILTLNNNSICDLNEISHLVQLTSLKELSFGSNPCLDFSDDGNTFNYRPFIKNWCSSLTVLDNCPLDDIECLKAEWLYSQGRGRSFRPGEHAALAEYLSNVCPYKGEQTTETEDVRKLKLILSKAQQHQQQLREQLSSGSFGSLELHKRPHLKKKPVGLPDRMVTSFQDSPSRDYRYSPDLMTRSLDSGMMRNSSPPKINRKELSQTPLQSSTTFIPIPDTLISPDVSHSLQPLTSSCPRPSSISSRTSHSSSRNSPHSTPESKRKTTPNVIRRQSENSSPVATKKHGKLVNSRSSTPIGRSISSRSTSSPGGRGDIPNESEKNYRETSEDEDSEILALKLLAIQQRASQRKQNKMSNSEIKKGNREEKENVKKDKAAEGEDKANNVAWKAAVCIQRRWRGYRARNLNGEVLAACKSIQMSRMQDYITKVINDMEATRLAIEGNRKLQVLQMQAINALWKKMTALQPHETLESSSDNKATLQNLIETCSSLHKQVEGLQAMMKSMQTTSSSCQSIPMATQTEIVAVHTPQGEEKENFPYCPKPKNSSSDESHPASDSPLRTSDDNRVSVSLLDSRDSENGSFTDTLETVAELDSKRIIILPKEEVTTQKFPEEELNFLSEKLTKPSVRLNETSSEISQSTIKDNLEGKIQELMPQTPLENREEEDVQNRCQS